MDLKESIELEDHKAELTRKLMRETENFKAVILAGQNALKSAILINGGAVVALRTTWRAESPTLLKLLAAPLLWFVAGVLLDALATGATYVSQLCYALDADSGEKLFKGGRFSRLGNFARRSLLADVRIRYVPRLQRLGQVVRIKIPQARSHHDGRSAISIRRTPNWRSARVLEVDQSPAI